MTLSAFRATTQQGLARTNQFYVAMNLPTLLLGQVTRDGSGLPANSREILSVQVESVTIPSFEIGEIPVQFGGERVVFAGDRVYNDLVMNFRVDVNYRAYEALMAWQDMMVSLSSGCRITDNDNISSDIVVNAVYRKGCPRQVGFTWKFNDCKLKSIGEINLDHKSENEYVVVQATFNVLNYDYASSDALVPIL